MRETRQLCLRAWTEDDLPALQVLRNDVPLQAQLLARALGSDLAAVREWLHRRASPPTSWLRIVADAVSGRLLGYLQIADIDAIDRRGELGICLAPEAQGGGAGRAAVRLALDEAARDLGLRKILLRVRSDNQRAIRCYEACGFARCGLLREHVFIEDAWRDLLLMECFLHGAGPA